MQLTSRATVVAAATAAAAAMVLTALVVGGSVGPGGPATTVQQPLPPGAGSRASDPARNSSTDGSNRAELDATSTPLGGASSGSGTAQGTPHSTPHGVAGGGPDDQSPGSREAEHGDQKRSGGHEDSEGESRG